MTAFDGPPTEEPLVVRIVVDAKDVEIFRHAAKLWAQPARQHVPRLKLSAAIRLGRLPVVGSFRPGDGVDHRIHLHNPRLPIHTPERFSSGNRRSYEVLLQCGDTPP